MSPLRSFVEATHGDRATDVGTYASLGFGGLATSLDLLAQAVPGMPTSLSGLGIVPLGIISALTAFRIWQGNVKQAHDNDREKESHRHQEAIIRLRIEEELAKRQDVSPVHVRVGADPSTAEIDRLPPLDGPDDRG